jgi:anti-anti-sigma factor
MLILRDRRSKPIMVRHNTTMMNIEKHTRYGYIVLVLSGDLDTAAAPQVQRVLLKCLAEQPDAVICDLSNLEAIDPVCATVFAAVAHRPTSRWPDSSVLLCCARSAVAAVLLRRGLPRLLPVHDTLDQALAHARSRPPFLRERLHLAPTLHAIATARWFVADVSSRWELSQPTETAQVLASELVADAVVNEPGNVQPIELRLELRAAGMLIAVQSSGPPGAETDADHHHDAGSGLEVVKRITKTWGVRKQPDGSRVVWCIVRPDT